MQALGGFAGGLASGLRDIQGRQAQREEQQLRLRQLSLQEQDQEQRRAAVNRQHAQAILQSYRSTEDIPEEVIRDVSRLDSAIARQMLNKTSGGFRRRPGASELVEEGQAEDFQRKRSAQGQIRILETDSERMFSIPLPERKSLFRDAGFAIDPAVHMTADERKLEMESDLSYQQKLVLQQEKIESALALMEERMKSGQTLSAMEASYRSQLLLQQQQLELLKLGLGSANVATKTWDDMVIELMRQGEPIKDAMAQVTAERGPRPISAPFVPTMPTMPTPVPSSSAGNPPGYSVQIVRQ